MKRSLLAALLVATFSATLAACSGKGGDMSVNVTLSPDPPKKGAETLTVTVKDASGDPVRGANVSIATNMPSMSMPGPKLNATDNGDGTYTARAQLDYATRWTFDIAATVDGRTAITQAKADVK